MKSWRKPNSVKPPFGSAWTAPPATRIFDNVSFIGNVIVGCYVVETGDGFILIDCMEPDDQSRDTIVQGIADLGLDIHDLKAILISHGHFDHYGQADWFRRNYGCKLYLGETDTVLAKTVALDKWPVIGYDIDCYYNDGEILKFGDLEIMTVLTPGHTKGCYSFILPVYDEGRKHMAGMWGGSGLLPDSDPYDYRASLDKFTKLCREYHVDVELCAHPTLDNGLERHELIRKIVNGVPNPFVIGEEGFAYYMTQYYDLVEETMIRRGLK
ncbi:MAG: MBL fold metallo-hydrolase [Solobacterium sp.]|nr:MBL fold metallo-hydrolase [Solobacterium sp.]